MASDVLYGLGVPFGKFVADHSEQARRLQHRALKRNLQPEYLLVPFDLADELARPRHTVFGTLFGIPMVATQSVDYITLVSSGRNGTCDNQQCFAGFVDFLTLESD